MDNGVFREYNVRVKDGLGENGPFFARRLRRKEM